MNKLILLFSIIVALLMDVSFFHYSPNLSVLIFILILNAGYLLIFKENFKLGFNIETFISIANIGIGFSYFIFNQKELRVINFWVILILLLAQLLLLFKKSKYKWYHLGFMPDAVRIIATKSFSFISLYFTTLGETFKDVFNKNISQKSNIRKVLLGFIMVLPVLIVVTGLLASSDLVFSKLILRFTKMFEYVDINLFLNHSVLVFMLSLPIFSLVYYLNLKRESSLEKDEKMTLESRKFEMDPVVLSTALVAINFIYILFVVIQFSNCLVERQQCPLD